MSLLSRTGWPRRSLLAACVLAVGMLAAGMTAPAKAQYYGYPYYAGYCNPYYYPYGCGYGYGYPAAYAYPLLIGPDGSTSVLLFVPGLRTHGGEKLFHRVGVAIEELAI